MFAESRGSSGVLNNTLDVGSNSGSANMELGQVCCQVNDCGWVQGESGMKLAGKHVCIDIQLGESGQIAVRSVVILMSLDMLDLGSWEQ